MRKCSEKETVCAKTLRRRGLLSKEEHPGERQGRTCHRCQCLECGRMWGYVSSPFYYHFQILQGNCIPYCLQSGLTTSLALDQRGLEDQEPGEI